MGSYPLFQSFLIGVVEISHVALAWTGVRTPGPPQSPVLLNRLSAIQTGVKKCRLTVEITRRTDSPQSHRLDSRCGAETNAGSLMHN